MKQNKTKNGKKQQSWILKEKLDSFKRWQKKAIIYLLIKIFSSPSSIMENGWKQNKKIQAKIVVVYIINTDFTGCMLRKCDKCFFVVVVGIPIQWIE